MHLGWAAGADEVLETAMLSLRCMRLAPNNMAEPQLISSIDAEKIAPVEDLTRHLSRKSLD